MTNSSTKKAAPAKATPKAAAKAQVILNHEYHVGDDYTLSAQVFNDGTVIMDGKPVAFAGVLYLIGYGLKQSIADSRASIAAKDMDDAEQVAECARLIQSRRDKIVTGDISNGAGRRSKSPLEREIETLAEALYRAASIKKGVNPTAKAVKSALPEFIASNRTVLEKQAESRLAALASVDLTSIEV